MLNAHTILVNILPRASPRNSIPCLTVIPQMVITTKKMTMTKVFAAIKCTQDVDKDTSLSSILWHTCVPTRADLCVLNIGTLMTSLCSLPRKSLQLHGTYPTAITVTKKTTHRAQGLYTTDTANLLCTLDNAESAVLALPAQGCLGCRLHIQTAGGPAGPCCDFTGSKYGDRNTEAVMML